MQWSSQRAPTEQPSPVPVWTLAQPSLPQPLERRLAASAQRPRLSDEIEQFASCDATLGSAVTSGVLVIRVAVASTTAKGHAACQRGIASKGTPRRCARAALPGSGYRLGFGEGIFDAGVGSALVFAVPGVGGHSCSRPCEGFVVVCV
jgi:hypothetical protein